MSHVFISYSREDQPAVKLIAEALEAEGVPVWWDRAIKAGENFDEILERRLREAAVVVVLWSKRSAQSKWVRAEATLGQRASALIPAMIEDCERPLIFELIQTADLRRWTGDRADPNWRGFVDDIRAHAATRRKAASEPAAQAVAARPRPTASAAPTPTPSAPPAKAKPAAAQSADISIETTFWTSAKDSSDIADFEAYLERYPNGHFAALARNRILALKAAVAPKAEAVMAAPAPAPEVRTPPPAQKVPQEDTFRRPPAEPARAAKGAGRGLFLGLALAVLAIAGAGGAWYFLAGNSPPGDTLALAGGETDPTDPAGETAPPADDPATDVPPAATGDGADLKPLVVMAEQGEVGPIPSSAPDGETAQEPAEDKSAPFRDCDLCPLMAPIPEGRFMMGSPDDEPLRFAYEGPQRAVSISAFAMSVHEVTFDEWQACVEDGGCGGYQPGDEGWGRGTRPVINISWSDATAYVRWLSQKTGQRYRLPTEAEWEYAARGGTTTAYIWGETFDRGKVPLGTSMPVGTFEANGFGLHDMAGNAREWVEDCYVSSYTLAPSDGSAAMTGDCQRRVVRGGAFNSDAQALRVANRARLSATLRDEYLGLRVARDL